MLRDDPCALSLSVPEQALSCPLSRGPTRVSGWRCTVSTRRGLVQTAAPKAKIACFYRKSQDTHRPAFVSHHTIYPYHLRHQNDTRELADGTQNSRCMTLGLNLPLTRTFTRIKLAIFQDFRKEEY